MARAFTEQPRLYCETESTEQALAKKYHDAFSVFRFDAPVTVSKTEIVRAAIEDMPRELFNRVHIFNGNTFILYPEEHVMRTHVDTLLVRMSIINGRPKYLLLQLDLMDGTLEVIELPVFLRTKTNRVLTHIYSNQLEQLDFELGQAIEMATA